MFSLECECIAVCVSAINLSHNMWHYPEVIMGVLMVKRLFSSLNSPVLITEISDYVSDVLGFNI